MSVTQQKGKAGEIAAARYLRAGGYDIVTANYRTKTGEIDLIAEKDGVMVFAEVKTRGFDAMNRPAFSVDYAKQQKIIATAAIFIQTNKLKNPARFDIIEVYIGESCDHNSAKVNHIINAFEVNKAYADF